MKDRYTSTIQWDEVPFNLPDNWQWFRWSDLMVSYQQGMIRSNSELGNGNVHYLKMGDLNGDGTAIFDHLTRAQANINEIEQYSLKEGDFLINVRNSKELVGKTCITPELTNCPVLFNHMLVRIDHGNKDVNYFVNAFLNIPTSRKLLDRVKQGTTTVIALYQRDLNNIPIALPDENTFHLIVSSYKNLLNKCSINNRINAELEAMAKMIYDYWFVQFDFPVSKEQAKAMGKPKLEGKPYKASGGRMVWSEELKKEVPEEWELVPLKSLVNLIKGNVSPDDIDSETPYVGLEHIPRKTITLNEWGSAKSVDSDKCVFQKHDILFGKIRPYFHKVSIALISGITSTDTIVMRAKNGNLTGYALQCVFSEAFVEAATKSSKGSKMPRADWNILKDYLIPKPSDHLLHKYQGIFQSIVTKIELNVLENRELVKLRDWILPMLMNGQVKIKEATLSKVVKPHLTTSKPTNSYFYQTQLVAAIVNASKKHKITHGEMTLAKYTYLVDKLYGVPTYFDYERLHLGPYPKEMKKIVNNKKFFKIQNNEVSVVPHGKEYNYQFQKQVEEAVAALASIFNQYKGQERSHQTELLATVCKVVEDIKSTDLKAVRESMKNWPIDLKTSKFKNKAEKFSEEETVHCLRAIRRMNWERTLLRNIK